VKKEMIPITSLPIRKLIHSSIKLKCVKNTPLLASVTMEISVNLHMDLMKLSGFQQINILERKNAPNIGIKAHALMEQDANSAIVTLRMKH